MLARLRRLLAGAEPVFEDRWRDLLTREFEHWSTLTDDEAERMERLVASFVRGWRWEAAKDFDLTEEVKVLIAAQAAMLLLGLEIDEFPHLSSVIVHPSTVRLTGHHATGGGLMSSSPRTLLGQAQYRGPVVLSWSAARSGARRPERGQNVVYHEFAHRLDMLDGVTDGTPPLENDADRQRWVEVCTTAYDTVRAEGSPVLRPYAGTNPAEFFAVATEVFFNRPHDLCEHEPALYHELHGFYHQDPAARPSPGTGLSG
jgi:Mlc titration factor MtfA (ptsG expression regulator)